MFNIDTKIVLLSNLKFELIDNFVCLYSRLCHVVFANLTIQEACMFPLLCYDLNKKNVCQKKTLTKNEK